MALDEAVHLYLVTASAMGTLEEVLQDANCQGHNFSGSQRFSAFAAARPHFLRMNFGFLTSLLNSSLRSTPISNVPVTSNSQYSPKSKGAPHVPDEAF